MRIFAIVTSLCLFSCNTAKFTRGTDKVPQASVPDKTPATPTEDDVPEKPTGSKTSTSEGNGTPLKLAPIPDQQVNAGKTSVRYSETLSVPYRVEGGKGAVTVHFTMEPSSAEPYLENGAFVWLPGFYQANAYKNEVGSYKVTLIATDASGTEVKSSFAVKVRPITWATDVVGNDDNKMRVKFTLNEELHPSRTYTHQANPGTVKLNTQTCVSFAPGKSSIQLDGVPTVTSGNPPQNKDGVYVHEAELTIPMALSRQPSDNTVFVTWLNFKASDLSNFSGDLSSDNGILVYYAYARCRNGPQDQQACKEAALAGGLENYYYCSNYFAGSDHERELKKMFCNIAKLSNRTPTGC